MPTDKQRLDWLSEKGEWIESRGLLGVVFLPSHLENGQTVRQAIDRAIQQEKGRRIRTGGVNENSVVG